MIELLFELIVVHALADFSLQIDAMAKGKNRNRKPDFVPVGQKLVPCWYYWLSAHAFIHGGFVYLVTGSLVLGLVETVAHFLIDFGTCENWTNPHQDQILHFACRLLYVYFLI